MWQGLCDNPVAQAGRCIRLRWEKMPTSGRCLQARLVALDNLLDFIVTYTIHSQAANQKKRFEVVLAVFASILFLISVISVAVLVRLTSKGSVLYRSDRAGCNSMI